MIHAAHASRWHWGRAGGPEQWAIGDWLCSRVYAVLDRGEPALYHAQRCLAVCEEHRMGNFVPASAHEALARAHAVLGDMDLARIERNLAYADAIDLDDDEATMPVVKSPESIFIAVAGGPGRHNLVIPTTGDLTECVTRQIAFKDGQPIKSVHDFTR